MKECDNSKIHVQTSRGLIGSSRSTLPIGVRDVKRNNL